MTPIKVRGPRGEFEVRTVICQAWTDNGLRDVAQFYVRGADGADLQRPITDRWGRTQVVDTFDSLPMALRVAAEAAGIERQRVEVFRYLPIAGSRGGYGQSLMTYSPNLIDYFEVLDRDDVDEMNELGDMAHEYARERYAALERAA